MATHPKPLNPALHDAVQAFVAAARPLLSEWGLMGSVSLPDFAWEPTGDDQFVLRERVRPMPHSLELSVDGPKTTQLKRLPENLEVARLLEADPELGPRLGKIIHRQWGSQRFGSGDQATILLQSLAATQDGWSSEDFEQAYLPWEADLYSKWNETPRLYPLESFVCDGGPVALSPDLVLRPMTDAEIAACLKGGLVGEFPGANFQYVTFGRWCLAGSIRTRRLVLDPEEDPEMMAGVNHTQRVRADVQRAAEDFLCALRLFKSGEVRIAGSVDFRGDEPPAWNPSSSARSHTGPYELRADDVNSVQQLWHAIRHARVRQDRSLQIALARFGYANDRSLVQDRIIDLMIAAEAWFLGNGRGELRYRLAVNGATWMAGSRPKRSTFDFLRHAYDVRSSIVHGDRPDKKALVSESCERLDERDFAAALESFIRDALRLAVGQVASGRWLGEWDALLLGEAPGPGERQPAGEA